MKAKSQLLMTVEKHLRENCGVLPGERLLVAVSGGVDSMVLLHLLTQVAKSNAWVLGVAHLNHGLRGEASHADEKLVRQTANALGWECFCARVKAERLRQTAGLSLEMAARAARHRFLVRTARKFQTRKVVLAHHADDQLELFFLRLMRGSGSEGLAGMDWTGPSPVDAQVRLLRPLLQCSKEEPLKYALEEQIQYREDQSNQDRNFERNWVRHELLPLLLARRPALPTIVPRIMETLGAEADCLDSIARDWLAKANNPAAADSFSKLHPALQRTCLRLQLPILGIPPEFELIERLRAQPGKVIVAPGGKPVMCAADGRLKMAGEIIPTQFNDTRQVVLLTSESGRGVFGNLTFQWEKGRGSPARENPSAGIEYFDVGKLGDSIALRYWCPGDRMQPIGMSHPVKLQDLFINAKIPKAERHQRVVGVAENGQVFWVNGLRIGDCFKLDKRTRLWLKWRWQRVAPAG